MALSPEQENNVNNLLAKMAGGPATTGEQPIWDYRPTDPWYKKAYKTARVPVNIWKKGWGEILDAIPEGERPSVMANLAINLPKTILDIGQEVTGELYLSPESWAFMGAGSAARAGKVVPRIGSLLKKVPGAQKLMYRGGQPASYIELAEARITNIAKHQEEAQRLGRAASTGFSPAQQRRATQIARGGISIGEREAGLRGVVSPIRSKFDLLEQEAKELGILSQRTRLTKLSKAQLGDITTSIKGMNARIERLKGLGGRDVAPRIRKLEGRRKDLVIALQNHFHAATAGEKYVPRLYGTYEFAQPGKALHPTKGARPIKIGGERFLRRKEIPIEQRANMQELRELPYPAARGIAQVARDVETARFFRTVSRNPQWISDAKTAGWERLPLTKKLGELSGKHAHPAIADDINEIVRVQGAWEKGWRNFLGKWKFGKVIMNPATHFRNLLSNSILLDLSGVNWARQARLIPKAGREMLGKGKYFQEAREAGLLGHEFYGGEIKKITESYIATGDKGLFDRTMGVASKFGNKLGEAYQAEEQLFKLAKYISMREAGTPVKVAVAEAEKWLFNYEKVGPAVKWIREAPLGSPFFTFSAKAIPRIMETAVSNPVKLYKYKLIGNAIEDKARETLGMDQDDVDVIKRNAHGTVLILPFQNPDGDPITLDLSYILPWGDIGESGGIPTPWGDLPPVASPSGPVKSLFEIYFNKNTFTGKEIYSQLDSPSAKASKISDHMMKMLTPSFTPGIPSIHAPMQGGYSFQRLRASAQGRPYGAQQSVQPISQAILSTVFGIKTTPMSPEEQRVFEVVRKRNDMREAKRQLNQILRRPSVSDRDKERAVDDFYAKAERATKETLTVQQRVRQLFK